MPRQPARNEVLPFEPPEYMDILEDFGLTSRFKISLEHGTGKRRVQCDRCGLLEGCWTQLTQVIGNLKPVKITSNCRYYYVNMVYLKALEVKESSPCTNKWRNSGWEWIVKRQRNTAN
jgi:hypothetical protein